jgi:hypothetical protein
LTNLVLNKRGNGAKTNAHGNYHPPLEVRIDLEIMSVMMR